MTSWLLIRLVRVAWSTNAEMFSVRPWSVPTALVFPRTLFRAFLWVTNTRADYLESNEWSVRYTAYAEGVADSGQNQLISHMCVVALTACISSCTIRRR